MSDFIDISLKDYKAVLSQIDGTNKQVDRASIAAINGVVNEYQGVLANAVSKAEAVPLKALLRGGARGKGRRIFVSKAKSSRPTASIWIGYNPVQAAYLGRLVQNKQGAGAGQHFFPGSFIATMRSGHRSVFHRVPGTRMRNKNKQKTREDAHEMLQAESVVAGVRDRMSVRLTDLFREKIDKEVSL